MQPSDIQIGQRYRWTGWEGFASKDIPDRQIFTEEELCGKSVEVLKKEELDEKCFCLISFKVFPFWVNSSTLSPLEEGANDANPQD